MTFCLPYAGGDEFAYWRWADLLAGAATVHAVGRDTGLSVEAVTDLISATTGPFAALRLYVDGFIDQLILRADTLTAVRDDPDVRDALVSALATDLAWLQGYRFTSAPPLPVPVVAFAATHDNEVPAASLHDPG